VRDNAPEFGCVALHLDERSAKLRLFCSLGQRLLEQTAKPILFPLNPEDVLNFLPSAGARNVSGQKQTTKDLSTGQPRRILEGLEAGEMLLADPHPDEMPKTPHPKSIDSVQRLSSADLVLRVRISRRR